MDEKAKTDVGMVLVLVLRNKKGTFFQEMGKKEMGNRKRGLGRTEHARNGRRKRRCGESRGSVERLALSCSNCQRTEFSENARTLMLQQVAEREIVRNKKGKFSMVGRESWDNCMLCGECHAYFCSENFEGKSIAAIVWPAFVWKALNCISVPKRGLLWSLMPGIWRRWWLPMACQLEGLRYATVLWPLCLVEDVTEKLIEIKKVKDELKWRDIEETWDKHCSLPFVHCPWGCSDFYHQCNDLPFDALVAWFVEESIVMYSARSDTYWTRGIRKDFLLCQVRILNNPEWICQASIVMTVTLGPRLLCCRHHSSKITYEYVHACRNPFGCISFEESNQIGSIVPIPRIIRPMKRYQFCTSFQMNKIVGNYNGLDCMYLSDQGNFDKNVVPIVHGRNALTIRGRHDIRSHLRRLYRQRRFPKWMLEEMITDSFGLFGNEEFEKYKSGYCFGATMISVEDALQLDRATREKETREIFLNDRVRIHYVPKWPSALISVHPAGCNYGALPPCLPVFSLGKRDTRVVWLLVGMIAMNAKLWYLVDKQIKSIRNWEGWVLAFVTEKVFPYKGRKASRNNPFKKGKTMVQLLNKLQEYGMGEIIAVSFEDLFGAYQEVKVCMNRLVFDEIIDKKVEVCILINENMGEELPMLNQTTDELELRWVGSCIWTDDNRWEGTIYCRHGGVQHYKWWKMKRSTKRNVSADAFKVEHDHVENLIQDIWDVAVYVRKNTNNQTLRYSQEKYLRMLGGQTRAYCKTHRYALISTIRSTNTNKRCVCYEGAIIGRLGSVGSRHESRCNQKAVFECPDVRCGSYLCKRHFLQLKESFHIKFMVARNAADCGYVCFYVEEEEDDSSRNSMMNNDDSVHDNVENRTCEHGEGIVEEVNIDECEDIDSSGSEDFEVLDNNIGSRHENPFENELPLDEPILSDDESMNSLQSLEGEKKISSRENAITSAIEDDLDFTCIDEDKEDDEDFPATNAGKKQMNIFLSQKAAEGGVAKSCILMNTLGHCLIRRQRNINRGQGGRYFLQKQVAVAKDQSLPLVYLEGMLFPNIFWSEEKDFALTGSLPSALLNDNYTLNQLGFASLMDHFRCRLTDCSLLTSTDYKYQFIVWDALANIGARGNNSSVILHRGFAERQGNEGIKMRDEKEPVFDAASIDTRPIVNKLSAAMKEECCHYFFTFTPNEKTMIGLKTISAYLDSEDCLRRYWQSIPRPMVCHMAKHSYYDEMKIRSAFESSSCFLKLRCWMELSYIILRYIQDSPELPLGEIKKLFARLEQQANNELYKALLPHWHLLVTLCRGLDANGHALYEVLDRIRGSIADLIRSEEAVQLKEQGIIKNDNDLQDVIKMAKRFLTHHCTTGRCLIPVKNQDGTKEVMYKCKAPNNRKLSSCPCDHCFIPIDVKHSEASLEVMAKIGIIEEKRNDEGGLMFILTEEWKKSLTCERHVPPTFNNEGIISPTNGGMFARLRCAQNLQFTGTSDVGKYLTKYIGEIDKCNKIFFSAGRGSDVINVDFESLHNTKITSVKMQEQKMS